MGIQKFSAPLIFDGYRFLHDHVLVTDASGTVRDLLPLHEAGEGFITCNGILSPGFINCHCHLELSHMKGRIAEKTGLVDFVVKVVSDRHHEEAFILDAIDRSESDMIAAGIVAVGDICNNTLTLPQKEKGRLRYYNFIEASGWLPSVSEARFERALQLYQAFSTEGQECSIVPHAPYSVSDALWTRIQPYFEDRVVSIHNQETAYEDDFFREGSGDLVHMYSRMGIDNTHHKPSGASSLQTYYERLAGARKAILVHNTFTGEADLDYIKKRSAEKEQGVPYFCLCINANLYIEGSLPPVSLLLRQHCNIVLGTDSLASNHSLSILEEIKTIREHFPSITLETLLTWATSNGAAALGMHDSLGSFEKGKRPGVVCIDAERWTAEKLM
jgi:aminodeoxyfutalosine deaminase